MHAKHRKLVGGWCLCAFRDGVRYTQTRNNTLDIFSSTRPWHSPLTMASREQVVSGAVPQSLQCYGDNTLGIQPAVEGK